MSKNIKFTNQKAFTMMEVLIVVLILSIVMLFSITFFQDINMRARDAGRLADLTNIQQAIQIVLNEAAEKNEKSSTVLCTKIEPPCSGSSFPFLNQTRNTDGKGWIKIDFDDKAIANFYSLPLDPINNDEYNFQYFSDGKSWKMETKFESQEFKKKMETDNGTNPNKFEISQKVKN